MPWKAYHKARLLPYRSSVNLEDSNWQVRKAAVQALAKLPAEALAAHAPAIVGQLEHSSSDVRSTAVQALAKLPADAFAAHAPAIVGKLKDSDENVRQAALATLPAEALAARP